MLCSLRQLMARLARCLDPERVGALASPGAFVGSALLAGAVTAPTARALASALARLRLHELRHPDGMNAMKVSRRAVSPNDMPRRPSSLRMQASMGSAVAESAAPTNTQSGRKATRARARVHLPPDFPPVT